jgi:superfamily II DNA/RNA helicase
MRGALPYRCVVADRRCRGLDIPEVEVVISYDVAISPEVYIHRSGRTARAGTFFFGGGRGVEKEGETLIQFRF